MGIRLTKLMCVTGLLLAAGGCSEDLQNLTASLGGDVAGERGSGQVLFINNTPYRAVFTFGTYDQVDPKSVPDFSQFDLNERGPVLEGDSSSDILIFQCGRVFSLGGPRLLALIEENLPDADISEEAMIEGLEFYESDPDDPAADPVSKGKSPPFEALLGVDFPCNALLIFYLEVNDGGSDPFRVDFELIPSESDR